LPNYWPLSDIDPAPGDAGALRGYAADLLRRAEGLRHVAAQIDRNAVDSGSTWIGSSGESFRAASARASAPARSLASKLEHASQAVRTFADDLQRSQEELKRWRDAARIATQDKLRAGAHLNDPALDPVTRADFYDKVNQADGKIFAQRRNFEGSVDRFNDAVRRCTAALVSIGVSTSGVARGPRAGDARSPKPFKPGTLHVADERGLSGTLYPSGAPSAADVTQGSIGDCWLMSALAAMAVSDEGRKKIMSMIRVNDDGTYTVTFADNEAVVVSGELYVDIKNDPIYAQGAGFFGINESWVQIIEKAYAARSPKGFPSLDGGDQIDALKVLGGYKTATLDLNPSFSFDPSDADIIKAIRKALDSGKPVTATSHVEGGTHAWTITDVRDGFVYVRNPWGGNQNADNFAAVLKGPLHLPGSFADYTTADPGTLKVPVKQFTNGFDNLEYAK
jgi:uncharacterized protein YukE